MRRSTIRWLAISALALAAGPVRAHDEPDREPPSAQGTAPRPAPGGAMSPDAHDPPTRDARSSRWARPGDAFGAASPEIEELDAPRKDDARARQRRDWLESIWSSP